MKTAATRPVARWFLSLRAYSFTASLMPVALALAMAYRLGSVTINWWTVPLFTAAALLFHAGTNVLNDYYDFVHGVDGPDDPDPSHAIPRGLVTPQFMFLSGHLYFFLGVVLGLAIGVERGIVFTVAGLAGALGAFLYTGYRFSFKYVALGDALVFFLMGPALVGMGYWAFTGEFSMRAVPASLPVAFLVTAILHGNNLRDLERDRAAGVRTLAGLIGAESSRRLFMVLLAGAYAVTLALVAGGVVHPLALTAGATMPAAARVGKEVLAARERSGTALQDLPIRCARLHLTFSLLYIGSVVLSPVVAGMSGT